MSAHAQISVSNRCNLRCRMCDIGQRDTEASGLTQNIQRGEELPPSTWLGILDSLGVEDVHIVGVEPLLYRDLDVLLDGLAARGMSSYVTTNGFLLDEDRAALLARYCARVDVSIDGPNAEVHDGIRGVTGSFDRATRGLRLLQDSGVRELNVSCAITPDNANHLVDTYDLFYREMGVGICFSHYNYIAPESCVSGERHTSNMGYDPKDVDIRAVNRAVKKCRGALFLPLLRGKRELQRYYKYPPTERIPSRCVVLEGILAGQRYTIAPDGTYLISARCWHASKIGSALEGDVPADSPIVLALARDIAEHGLPPECQRLCCSGKTV